MTPEKDLCIIAACDQRYEHYVPLFVLSATQAYPDARVCVFLNGEASEQTQSLLAGIDGNFHLYDNWFPGSPFHGVKSVLPAKAMRWLIYHPEFEQYEYIYIGDIDLCLCREHMGIVKPHLLHCEKLGLPYSTIMRAHQDRVRALVFAHRQEWYDAMRPVIKSYRPRVLAGEFDWIKSDEKLLYRMISDSTLPKVSLQGEITDVFLHDLWYKYEPSKRDNKVAKEFWKQMEKVFGQ